MRKRAIVAAVLVALALAGCSENVKNPSDGTDSGSSQYNEWKVPAQRGDPVTFESTTSSGEKVTSASLKGKVVVVNFWYAGCPPCRVEAKRLEAVHQANPSVEFIGVNTRDSAAEVDAFDKTYGITYPSVLDVSTGSMLLAFATVRPADATPTTLILDTQGRVAARVLGEVLKADILNDLIAPVVAESKTSG